MRAHGTISIGWIQRFCCGCCELGFGRRCLCCVWVSCGTVRRRGHGYGWVCRLTHLTFAQLRFFFLFRVTMSAVSFSWPQQVLSIRSHPSSLLGHKANPHQDVQEWHPFKRSYYPRLSPGSPCRSASTSPLPPRNALGLRSLFMAASVTMSASHSTDGPTPRPLQQ